MFHTLAWYISIGQAVDTDVTPVPDPVVLVQNSHFVPQTQVRLNWCYAASTTLDRARFATPKTRVVTNPWIRPIENGIIPADNPNVMDRTQQPFLFNGLEEIQLLATSGLATGNEDFFAVASIGVASQPVPAGDIYPLRFTSTTAAVDAAWSQLAVSFQDVLPVGTYAIVGLEVKSANAIAARLILQGQQFRPGSLSISALGNEQHSLFRQRKPGVYGTFVQTALPLVEVLCDGADAAHEGYLDIIRVG